jgi:superfamily II DNA or RNA helicase
MRSPHTRLSAVLSRQVSSQSRARGHAYFISGAVRSLTVQNGIIQATVRGSQLYNVWLEPAGDLLHASCTCPYFIDSDDICKHVWAVILSAEAQAVPLLSPGVDPDDVVLEPLIPDDYDFDLDVEDERGWKPAIPPVARTAAPAPRLAPQPPPPWRTLIDTVAATTPSTSPLRPRLASAQLLYVVDVAATNTSGALVIELMTRDRKANGDWGKPKPAKVTPADVAALPDLAEREILQRLSGARGHLDWGGYNSFGQELCRMEVRGILVTDVVPRACATGRCMARISAPAVPPALSETRILRPSVPSLAPLTWDARAPWSFAIGVSHVPAESNGGYAIEGWLRRDDERMELADALALLPDGVLFTRTHAAGLDHGGAFTWLHALRRTGRVTVPAGARDELADALLPLGPVLTAVPDDLRVETVAGQPRPHVRFRPTPLRSDRLTAELAFEYEGTLVAPESPRAIVRAAGAPRAIRRDVDAERRAMDVLVERGVRSEWNYHKGEPALQLPSTQLPRVVRQLLGDGWHVEAAGRTYRRPGGAPSLQVASGIDWFELSGNVTYDDQQASLPALLAALDRGEQFVTLDDGTVGLLPEEWLRKHAPIARLGSREGASIRFNASQVALLDSLVAAQPDASWDETFTRARAELRTFDGIRPLNPPATFAGTLRGYQCEGLGWLLFLQRFGFGGCLADDMGLGKTVMVLALLAGRRDAQPDADRRPSLVVAPRSVVFNWRQEAARFTPGLRVVEYAGSGRTTIRTQFGDHDLVLTTYGTLRRDAAHLAGISFDYVVLDEAQAIKNASSVSAKSTRLLVARHRLALSGTPIENHLGELWSLFEFLNPGLLSTAPAFERAGAGRRMDDDAIAMLARGLRPFILRRTKDQVAPELPAKTEQTLYCDLERPQRALYDQLLSHYRRTLLGESPSNGLGRSAVLGTGKAKLQILEALLRLRQAACHPGLIDKRRSNEASAKLDVLVPRIAEAVAEEHKTLVFSQFTSLLTIVRARLDEAHVPYEYLDGRTQDRQSKVERFQQDPACRLFLISLKAGGLGLNLTAAEYVFLLDPWWNPAVEAQAIDRAHRIGQTRHVFAYRLIARDTVEERVLELQRQKRGLADAILSADSRLLRDLRREDLELLLS